MLNSNNDPRKLTNLSEILSALSSLETEEAELSRSLADLLKQKEPIEKSLERLEHLIPHLDVLEADSRGLVAQVSSTAETAERIGSKVRSLDEEMSRVREAADRVGQVMDLKSSLSELQKAIDEKDWESATRHCARAMSLPPDVITGPFAEFTVPTSEYPAPPSQTLQASREQLLAIFKHHFEEASRSRDSSTTSRFFKLFPTIGWEKEGLELYANFVVELVKGRSPTAVKASSPLFYIAGLTSLFESIAMIVDQHQPVVEKYYGSGKMLSVLVRLLEECDKVTKSLKSSWEEDRGMQRKLVDIANNPPVFTIRRQQLQPQDDTGLDPRDIDKVLSELAGIIGRWYLFKKYLTDNFKSDEEEGEEETQSAKDQHDALEGLINRTASNRLFEDLISVYYVPLETWYTRTIIEKAHRMASSDMTQSPICSTTPDDVFYILKSVLTRVLTTGSFLNVEQTLAQLRDILDRDYVGMIKKKLDEVYKNPNQPSGVRPERVERENRMTFIMHLNDLSVSSSHLEKLVPDVTESPLIIQHFPEIEIAPVKDEVRTLLNSSRKMKSSLAAGIEQMLNQLLRPKLRNFISDVYKDISYVLDEDGYANAEYQNLTRKRFVKGWESILDGYKDAFSEDNYRTLIGLILDLLIRPWEKLVTTMKYTELGAVRFDRDLRAIIAYLASQTMFGDLREKFVRLQQISTLLNLDGDEDVDEFYNGSGISWKIGPHEARAIANLKI
ncbi:hypothetical protein CVT24_003057 [Panaeolus cyanescens]|uniref:Conserved oligomeric Golgi complex subunit 4 n=1 Tax=Panaeolus cyanescens TaxID=181874 RepID=A0A409VFR8_9AGAR|nr:hypothetical protein CVT24_003057 [Panaeolus cyanescens]